jgi:RNA polymerase sigma-70 factor (ECF subfamily)
MVGEVIDGLRPTRGAKAAPAAADGLLEGERSRLLALAYSVLHDREQARDVVQDTMERALRSWSSLREIDRYPAWLSTICVRRALRVRRRRGVVTLLRHHDEVAITPTTRDIDLERGLHRLSARQRAVVALHYVYGYTLDESARVLGCRPGTVRSHLARALQALREELER